jgi:hypothetical protein
MKTQKGFRKLWVLFGVMMLGGLFSVVSPASAQLSGGTVEDNLCMQRIFMGPTATVTNSNQLNCTANDIRLSRAISVSPTSCIAGQKIDLTATFEVIVTANSRYDAGFFFRVDGGSNARGDGPNATGECSLSWLTPGVPPALAITSSSADKDSCGDLNSGTYNVTFTIPQVLCEAALNTDPPVLKLPNCTSWHSNSSTACTAPGNDNSIQAASYFHPDTKSKCVCDDNFTVPVIVEHPNITVDKTASPTQLNEPGGNVTYTVKVTNPAEVAFVTLTSISDDPDNNTATANIVTYLPIPPGQNCPGSLPTGFSACTTCDTSSSTTAVVLAPGASTNCTFVVNVQGSAGANITNKACVNGTDSNGGAIGPTCDTATVSILDVGPTAAVTKTVDSLQCVVVRYKVKVENTDTVESLSLTALSDSPFGSITSVQGNVLGTTCGVADPVGTLSGLQGITGAGILPATILSEGMYTCYFDAKFCTGSNTDTVTATLKDGDKHCSAGTAPEPPPASGEVACLTNADCPTSTQNCVDNQIMKTGSVTATVAVVGQCSQTTATPCVVNENCPSGETCQFPY